MLSKSGSGNRGRVGDGKTPDGILSEADIVTQLLAAEGTAVPDDTVEALMTRESGDLVAIE